jgi:hypothetical protein
VVPLPGSENPWLVVPESGFEEWKSTVVIPEDDEDCVVVISVVIAPSVLTLLPIKDP